MDDQSKVLAFPKSKAPRPNKTDADHVANVRKAWRALGRAVADARNFGLRPAVSVSEREEAMGEGLKRAAKAARKTQPAYREGWNDALDAAAKLFAGSYTWVRRPLDHRTMTHPVEIFPGNAKVKGDHRNLPRSARQATTRSVAMKPQRIQRKRTKGWRMPPNTIYVGRPSKWGNRYYAGMWRGYTAAEAKRDFERWVRGDLAYAGETRPPPRADIRRELRGKNLACWCKPGSPCHADVLLELANR